MPNPVVIQSGNLLPVDFTFNSGSGKLTINTGPGSSVGTAISNDVASQLSADLVNIDIIAADVTTINSLVSHLPNMDIAAGNIANIGAVGNASSNVSIAAKYIALLQALTSLQTSLNNNSTTIANANTWASAATTATPTQSTLQSAISSAYSTSTAYGTALESTATVARMFHSGTVLGLKAYDTTKDSDGGQWRKHCAHLGYYNEAQSNTWIGTYTSESAARTGWISNFNLLLNPNLSDVSWLKQNAGVASVPVVTPGMPDPNGGTEAFRVVFNLNGGSTSSDFSQIASAGTAYVNGTIYTGAVTLKTTDGSTKQMSLLNPDGNVTQQITVTGQWQTFSVTSTASTTSTGSWRLRIRGAGENSSTTADIQFYAARLNTGNQPMAAVSAATVTGCRFRNSSDGFTYKLNQFSGVTQVNDAPVLTNWLGQKSSEFSARQSSVSGNNQVYIPVLSWNTMCSTDGTTVNGVPFVKVTKQTANTSEGANTSSAAGVSGYYTSKFEILGSSSSTQASFGLYDGGNSNWGNAGDTTWSVVSGPGTVTQYTGGLLNVTGLSTTVPLVVTVTRNFLTANATVVPYFYPDTSTSVTSGKYNYVGRVGVWAGQTAGNFVADSQVAYSYFQNTTDNKFYVLCPYSGITEIYRGASREFPARVMWVWEAQRVVGYDMTQANWPMWMVFNQAGASGSGDTDLAMLGGASYNNYTSIAAMNGKMYVTSSQGGSSGGVKGLYIVDFATEKGRLEGCATTYGGTFRGNIAQRNQQLGFDKSSLVAFADRNMNWVDVTVYPDAPFDTVSKLPIPTVAIATIAGLNIFKTDGTILVSSTSSGISKVTFRGKRLVCERNTSSRFIWTIPDVTGLANSFSMTAYYDTGIPVIVDNSGSISYQLADTKNFTVAGFGINGLGIVLLHDYPTIPAASMTAYIGTSYTTGWLVGDIRRSAMCDTTVETITASGELSPGTASVASWTSQNVTHSSTGSIMDVVASSTTHPNADTYTLTTVVGKWYQLTGSLKCYSTNATANAARVICYDTPSRGTNLGQYTVTASDVFQTFSVTFQATATNTLLSLEVASGVAWGAVNDKASFQNISVKLAEPDRSVKNQGFIVNGSLTKSAVNAGAQVVGYGNWSSTNYLYQPYSSDYDVGTGDFTALVWLNLVNTSQQFFFDRATSSSAGGRLALYINASNQWCYSCSASAAVANTGVTAFTGWQLAGLVRISGVLYFYLNGTLVSLGANTASITNTSAQMLLGAAWDTTTPSYATMALFRFSATSITANQAAFMYGIEKEFFLPGAQVTLGGSSTNALSITYNPDNDTYTVVTASGVSVFKDMVRIAYYSLPLVTSIGSELLTTLTNTSGTGLTVSGYTATMVNASNGATGYINNGTLVIGSQYLITFTVSGYTSGSLSVSAGSYGTGQTAVNANGTYSMISTCAGNSNLYVTSSSANTNAVVTVNSVKLVTGTLVYNSNMGIATIREVTAISSSNGAYSITVPTNIRDESYREDIGGKALWKENSSYEATSTGQTVFAIPVGMTGKSISVQGVLKREGSTKDFTRSYVDGQEFITFGTTIANGQTFSCLLNRMTQ